MRKQRWKKWVTLAVAVSMLVSQLGMLPVKAEEAQSAEEVIESVEETFSENEVAELETVETSRLEDEEETSEYGDEPVEGESNKNPDETEESGAAEEGNGETEPAQEGELGKKEITEAVTTVEEPERLVEEAGQECPEFSYVQDFSQQGVRVSIQAREGVVRVGTSVQITLMEESDVDALGGIVQNKIDEITEIRQQKSGDTRSIFEMYSNLETQIKKSYGFQIAMTYVDAEGNTHIIRPEENEAIQVSIEMLNSEELLTDDMHSVEVFSLTDEMPTPFAEGENVMPSVYSFVVVQYNARADAKMVAAQQKAWEFINTYADPEYFLDDPYKWNMTETQYEELRQAALAATVGCATPYDKIKAITGFVADRIYYDYSYYMGDTSFVYINPYDVYTQKRTVCSGYARLMRTMLISIGIPCMNIHGENHEYNAAYDSQQEKWVFTDATWCSQNMYIIDSNGNERWNKASCVYTRFDLSPEEIAQLSNHEVYQVDGLIRSPQDQMYYSLVAPGDNWQNMDWHMAITGPKDLNASKLLFVDEFAGMPVTEIEWHAFSGCSGLTGDLKLPSGLTEIGGYAFSGCSGLTGDLKLPSGLTEIGMFAFYECSFTGDLVLPSSLTEIGECAFLYCTDFTGIDLSGLDTSNMQNIEYAFNSCLNLNTIKSPLKMGTSVIRLRGTFVDPNGRETSVLSQEFCNTVLTRKEESNPTPTPTPTPTPIPTPVNPPSDDNVQKVQDFVSRMYTVALGRNAEEAGLNYWTNRLLTHEVDGAGIAYGFIMSDEFQNRNLSDGEFVDVLYRTFFNREAEEGGRSYWLSKLASGRTRGYVLSGFVNSVEFDDLCDSFGIARGTMKEDGNPYNPGIRQFVERQYTKVLNRSGEKDGINYWVEEIISGRHMAEDVAKMFFQSEEFSNRNLNDADYVETLYETFLGRASETDGKNYWLQQINNGMNRNTVLEGFSRSEEFAGILRAYGL